MTQPDRPHRKYLMTTDNESAYAAALDHAAELLGMRLEQFLGTAPGEPDNGADFKRLATVHTFGDAWSRTDALRSPHSRNRLRDHRGHTGNARTSTRATSHCPEQRCHAGTDR